MAKKTTTEPAPVLHDRDKMFEYTTPAGTIRIPYIENLPLSVIEDGQGMNVDEFVQTAWQHIMDEEQTRIRRDMTLSEYQDMLKTWDQESGISLGELFA